MIEGYRFDETARSERYFSGALFTHLLMANNFLFLKELFKDIFSEEEIKKNAENLDENDIEIVAELDPLRDGAIVNNDVRKFFKENGRVAVPDLFLRQSKLCLVIEAKFFTNPRRKTLQKQVNSQKRAINTVKNSTKYFDCMFKFATLTSGKIDVDGDTYPLYWSHILELANKIQTKSPDIEYAIQQIQDALERTKQNADRNLPLEIERMDYEQLLEYLSEEINRKNHFVGFVGGLFALQKAGDEYLRRRKYKVTTEIGLIKKNWISGDDIWSRISAIRADKTEELVSIL